MTDHLLGDYYPTPDVQTYDAAIAAGLTPDLAARYVNHCRHMAAAGRDPVALIDAVEAARKDRP